MSLAKDRGSYCRYRDQTKCGDSVLAESKITRFGILVYITDYDTVREGFRPVSGTNAN